jgi:hypothetical protein
METITRGPSGRHALALAVTALGLAALAGCVPSSPPHPPAHPLAQAVPATPVAPGAIRATPAATARATPTGGAVPGLPGSYRRAPLTVLSATFVSARTGWALGVRSWCRRGCRLELRKTTDHGRRWLAVPAPPAPYAPAGLAPAPGAVANIRFADARDGWAFGPGLWATHDGGRTWHQLSLRGWAVQSLAAGGGRVIAAVTRCLVPYRPSCGRFRVYTAPVTRDSWRPVPGASGTQGMMGGAPSPVVTVAGGTGLVTATGADFGPALSVPALLAGPADGSAGWRQFVTPCAKWPTVQAAATPGVILALGCATEPGAGEQLKRVYLGAAGGTWQRLADPSINGYLGTVSITPAGTILLSGGRSDVYVSWDGGRSWHGTARTSPSMNLAYQGGDTLSAAMTTDTQGFTLEPGASPGEIWFTYDDAHTWHLVTMH